MTGLAKTFGFGFGHKRTTAPTPITPLTIVTPPVISGATTIGATLTVATPAVWSGTPASRVYQWFQDASPIALATATSYVSVAGDLGHSITVKEQANNGALSIASQSNAIVIASSGGFATPTLTNFSTLGAAPLVLSGSTTDYVAGLRGQLQIATDSGFSTITQNWIFFIDGASWASADVVTSLVTPAGQYWSRWRVVRDNESGITVTGNDPLNNALSFGADVSPWSNTFTDTISASVAVLSTTTGVNKNSQVTISGSPALSFAGTNGVGATQGVRASIAQAADYAQFEVTLTSTPTASGVRVGWEDGTTDFNTGHPAPGQSNSLGVVVKFQSNGIFINWNSDANGATLTATAPISGDVYTFRIKKSTHAVEVWKTRSAVLTKFSTQTVPSFSAYFMWVGPLQNETGTVNFGATAFTQALDAGAVIYG